MLELIVCVYQHLFVVERRSQIQSIEITLSWKRFTNGPDAVANPKSGISKRVSYESSQRLIELPLKRCVRLTLPTTRISHFFELSWLSWRVCMSRFLALRSSIPVFRCRSDTGLPSTPGSFCSLAGLHLRLRLMIRGTLISSSRSLVLAFTEEMGTLRGSPGWLYNVAGWSSVSWPRICSESEACN